jgi:branched-chain amino acid transport system permease protein
VWGSIIAAAALTVLPELLREFADYHMLIYAIVLIVVMLFTNSTGAKQLISKVKSIFARDIEGGEQNG